MSAQDEVDRIVTAWERERPDLDPAPLQVFSRLSRLARQLELARREAFHTHGLESGAFDVLSALRRAGEPYELTPGKLLAETLVTSGTMTNRINRLARAGYVQRAKDPSDGRVVLVRLTAEGKAVVDAALADLLDWEAELLEGLDDSAQAKLAGLLRRLAAPFEEAS
ncbi:MAG TPA: MarR family transcriptional regulator [Beutenbergiaceae bacterium]|nr:MarR family transcriptional regulator [Beutenbergiaceae bacterium]